MATTTAGTLSRRTDLRDSPQTQVRLLEADGLLPAFGDHLQEAGLPDYFSGLVAQRNSH